MESPNWQLPESLRELEASGDLSIVRELISEFRHDSEDRLSRMEAASGSHDAPALKSQAHSLRGSASQMGANELAALCREIEAEAPGMDWERLNAQIARARSLFAAVVGEMSRDPKWA